jgi:hypothetical protein
MHILESKEHAAQLKSSFFQSRMNPWLVRDCNAFQHVAASRTGLVREAELVFLRTLTD